MICDICHKNEATILYSVIINNQKTELHLCNKCAAEKGLIKSTQYLNLKEFLPLPFRDSEAEKLRCSHCGLTYKDFLETARLGCSECYRAFRKKIEPLLRKIHGSTQHIGKLAPAKLKKHEKESTILNLKEHLKKAIESESYEEAARIRDELKKLKSSASFRKAKTRKSR